MTTTTVQKWGNSYAIRLPKASVDRLKLREGQAMTIEEHGDGLSLTPTAPESRTLKEMLAVVTPDTIHRETDWGPAVGKEVW